MKSDLLELIQQIDTIKLNFHICGGNGIPSNNIIYDTSEFSTWKQELQFELQDIYDRTKDKFIWNTLVALKQDFNGWKDERSFNELTGGLIAIFKNIDKYYPSQTFSRNNKTKVGHRMILKSPKVFVSHATIDKNYVSLFVELLEAIGLNENQIFCTSVPGFGIPLDEDIYEYLKRQFNEYNVYVIFVLSENYYKSVACMNEMGAAWVLQSKFTTVLLPGFNFIEIKGAINPRKIGLKLDNDQADVKERLGQLKDTLLEEFDLPTITDVRWEKKRDNFINSLKLTT